MCVRPSTREFRLARRLHRHPDFAEGVRAQVVDKDRTRAGPPPRWTRSATWRATSLTPAMLSWDSPTTSADSPGRRLPR
ncbi:enoyl-CoA hydratase/isomerase family protein [Aeromicrobium sp. UC242_57]|uniref:enoyl-CoA hydratase/isomerase family protein n=1 Tax=Aeromicrobium sp. UC242_57 TaxID=3374624 RepID=UPI0037ADD22C